MAGFYSAVDTVQQAKCAKPRVNRAWIAGFVAINGPWVKMTAKLIWINDSIGELALLFQPGGVLFGKCRLIWKMLAYAYAGCAAPITRNELMKYTLLVTQKCNLACEYCYVGKRDTRMSLAVARKIVDFVYRNTPPHEKIEVGFFGGEPLLEFELITQITNLIESHPSFDAHRIGLTVVSNGTIFSREIADFMNRHDMGMGISCDGPPEVHNVFRRFRNGRGTAHIVERTIRKALEAFSAVMVNAVYGPRTLAQLPQTVEYFSSLGVRQIYLNPDFTAKWRPSDIDALPGIYTALGRRYIEYYLRRDPHFVSTIDSKISVILRNGYDPLERCRMGRGEFAFTPEGDIYPCERLVGDGTNGHCIGNIEEGIKIERLLCRRMPGGPVNLECQDCSLQDYCMNWCGCTNFFSSGYYNRVNPFLCASEKAAIRVAVEVFQALENEGGATFFDHLGGLPLANSLGSRRGRKP